MGCVNVKLSDEIKRSPLYPDERKSTNVFWLIVFASVIVATLIFVYRCYLDSNWYNITDIQDYDGSGLIYVTQNAVVYQLNLAVAVGSAIGISLIVMILMMWLSSIFMVASLVIVSMYFIVLVALLWEQYDKTKHSTVLIAGIIISLLMGLWFYIFIQMGKKIELIFLLNKLAASAMKNSLRMLLYTPAIFLLNMFGVIVCIFFFCLVTAAWMEYQKFNDESLANISLINWSYALIVIMCMWWLHFTQGCLNFLVGFAVGAWYFEIPTVGKKFFTKSGTVCLIRYHMGTMCFGSFVMSIFWVIREILDLFRQFKLNNTYILKWVGSFAEWLLVCTQACWEIAATNSNYITSMYGFGYCSSTRRTIELCDNALQMGVGLVGNALSYMVILTVGLVAATLGVTVIKMDETTEQIGIGFVLFLLSVGLAWMILSVYVNITRALYICMTIDIDKNGSVEGASRVDPMIQKYISMVPKFSPPPPPPVQAPPPILPKGKRYEEDSEDEEEEEEEQMVQIIEV